MEVTATIRKTEFGFLPADWQVKRLGELFEITSSKRVFQIDWKSSGVPFYRARELVVLGDRGTVDNKLFITRSMYEDFKCHFGVPEPGDLLVTGVGTLGKVYRVRGDHDFYFKDGNIIWFRVAGSIESEYLEHLFHTPQVIRQVHEGGAGTTVGTYTIAAAKRTTIPVPSLPEQRAIATALSDVDALLGALDRLIAKKRDLKQAAMQQLLTGQTRLPGFSGEWDILPLSKTTRRITRGASPRPIDSPQWFDDRSNVGWVRISDVTLSHRYLEETTQRLSDAGVRNSRFVPAGSLIMSICATVGRPIETRIDSCIHDGFVVFEQPQVNQSFLYHVLAHIETTWSRSGQTGSQMNLNTGIINNRLVAIPRDDEEQSAIASVLSDMDAEIAALEARRAKTRDLKQAMMQELLTGRTRLV